MLLTSKDGIIKQIHTSRTTRDDILWKYERYKKIGVTQDLNKESFENIPDMTLQDLKNFQNTYLKAKPHTYLILGDKSNYLSKYLKSMAK